MYSIYEPINTASNCYFSMRNFLKETNEVSIVACRNECKLTRNCTHFTYNRIGKNCYLQQGDVLLNNLRKNHNPNVTLTCGILNLSSRNIRKNCYFEGEDILLKATTSFGDCAIECLSLNGSCSHFNYRTPNIRSKTPLVPNCYLKNENASLRVSSVDVTSMCGTFNSSMNLPELVSKMLLGEKDGAWCSCPCQVECFLSEFKKINFLFLFRFQVGRSERQYEKNRIFSNVL